MTGPGAQRISEAEAVLGVSLPEPVRTLYLTSDGWYSHQGQWDVVWPLSRVVDDNLAAWARGLPRNLLAFGDDGTGDPFCVDLDDPTDAVVRWNWIDHDIEVREGSMTEFRNTWLSDGGDPPFRNTWLSAAASVPRDGPTGGISVRRSPA